MRFQVEVRFKDSTSTFIQKTDDRATALDTYELNYMRPEVYLCVWTDMRRVVRIAVDQKWIEARN